MDNSRTRKKIAYPEEHYSEPQQVLQDLMLNRSAQKTILENWLHLELSLRYSEPDEVDSNREACIKSIQSALASLEQASRD